jgi:uncharacterized protein
VALFREAASKGIAESQFSLAMHFKEGTGVDQDIQQCIDWLERAADQGHAKALFNLGLIYERGQGVPSDPEKARSASPAPPPAWSLLLLDLFENL